MKTMSKLIVSIKTRGSSPGALQWEIYETDKQGLPLAIALAKSQEWFASEQNAKEAGDCALARFVMPATGEPQ
jgi:hypothetical protein